MHQRISFSAADPHWDSLEAEWMAQLARGGPPAREALSLLFGAYARLFIKRLAYFGLRDEAEDVAQGLWMEIARAAPRYRGDVPVRHFLRGFLKIAQKRYFFGRDERPELRSVDDASSDEDEVVTTSGEGRSIPEWIDFERCVRQALRRLEKRDPRLADLLLLRHVEEMSLDEMAEQMGGSPQDAKAEVYKARQKFSPLVKHCLELWPNRGGGVR